MSIARVMSIQVGKIAPLGPEGVPSAFVKQDQISPATVTRLGITGDEQADLTVHGGPDKAVYGYGLTNYIAWRADYPHHASLLVAGGFGENLTIDAMLETDLCVGDVHAIGSARLQVCQPRQPCFKFALRFADKHLPKAMVRNGRSGWYYRVIEAGVISRDDPVQLYDRPNPGFPFARLVELINRGKATIAELKEMQDMPGLAADWQRRARDMLGHNPPE